MTQSRKVPTECTRSHLVDIHQFFGSSTICWENCWAHCQQILIVADDISVTYHLDVDTMEEYTTSHPHVVVIVGTLRVQCFEIVYIEACSAIPRHYCLLIRWKENHMLWFDVLILGPWKVLICTCWFYNLTRNFSCKLLRWSSLIMM